MTQSHFNEKILKCHFCLMMADYKLGLRSFVWSLMFIEYFLWRHETFFRKKQQCGYCGHTGNLNNLVMQFTYAVRICLSLFHFIILQFIVRLDGNLNGHLSIHTWSSSIYDGLVSVLQSQTRSYFSKWEVIYSDILKAPDGICFSTQYFMTL